MTHQKNSPEIYIYTSLPTTHGICENQDRLWLPAQAAFHTSAGATGPLLDRRPDEVQTQRLAPPPPPREAPREAPVREAPRRPQTAHPRRWGGGEEIRWKCMICFNTRAVCWFETQVLWFRERAFGQSWVLFDTFCAPDLVPSNSKTLHSKSKKWCFNSKRKPNLSQGFSQKLWNLGSLG